MAFSSPTPVTVRASLGSNFSPSLVADDMASFSSSPIYADRAYLSNSLSKSFSLLFSSCTSTTFLFTNPIFFQGTSSTYTLKNTEVDFSPVGAVSPRLKWNVSLQLVDPSAVLLL